MRGIWRLLAPLSFALTSARVALWKIVTERPDIVLCIEPTFFVAPLVPAGDSVAMAREIGILVAEGKHPALGDGHKLAQSFDREACLAKFCSLLEGSGDQGAG
ncbi:MAG: hypothetical protein USCAAHI_02770 [Beijerinckiaceae bacterium]|nr:MAG: hypothetical protein USCAAHI_02770 [Beijerinckiaceae bacterium]